MDLCPSILQNANAVFRHGAVPHTNAVITMGYYAALGHPADTDDVQRFEDTMRKAGAGYTYTAARRPNTSPAGKTPKKQTQRSRALPKAPEKAQQRRQSVDTVALNIQLSSRQFNPPSSAQKMPNGPTFAPYGTAAAAPAASAAEVDKDATSKDALRKRQQRLEAKRNRWAVVAAQDHKDNYDSPINTNARNRSTKQLQHMLNPAKYKPPKNYSSDKILAILLRNEELVAVLWSLPHQNKCIIGQLVVQTDCVLEGEGVEPRKVVWKFPRHVIALQHEGRPEVVHQLWQTLAGELGDGVREITGDEACLHVHAAIVEKGKAGCFYYGPQTKKYNVVAARDGGVYREARL